MFQSELEVSSPNSQPIPEQGIWYDPEKIVLEGSYCDEVTAYRARRRWIRTFQTNFLLEGKDDFQVSVVREGEGEKFRLKCEFLTACGRYAFWRLTHNQAPEVQYLLETAHHPSVAAMPSSYASDHGLYGDIEPRMLSSAKSYRGPLEITVRKCLAWISGRLR